MQKIIKLLPQTPCTAWAYILRDSYEIFKIGQVCDGLFFYFDRFC